MPLYGRAHTNRLPIEPGVDAALLQDQSADHGGAHPQACSPAYVYAYSYAYFYAYFYADSATGRAQRPAHDRLQARSLAPEISSPKFQN